LFAVREEIEEARDLEPTENPKQILGALAPVLIERLQELDNEKKSKLVFNLLSRSFSKDIQFYFRDDNLQNFMSDTPFSGEVFRIPNVFSGDYLAVVNSNVAGGKTDIFINQSITLDSQITSEGTLKNDLTVERAHFGENEEQYLYRADNQNYIRVFTRPGSNLRFSSGITPKDIKPSIDYEEKGYKTDPTLASVENTRIALPGFDVEKYVESGKNVFGAWFSTPAGDTNTLKLVYETQGVLVHNGAKYQFVFDKQSGVESLLKYRVSAPPGYIWRESGNSIYEYDSAGARLAGRVTVDLTLVKDE
jgi:hypothetical protein